MIFIGLGISSVLKLKVARAINNDLTMVRLATSKETLNLNHTYTTRSPMNAQQKTSIGRKQVIKSSAWIFFGQFFGQLFRLVSNLIMTRLLVPEMFGLMTVANTVMLGLWLCSFMGIEHNVIQSDRGDDKDFLDSAWTFQVIRGVFLWVMALLISLGLYLANLAELIPVDSVYADENLAPIIAALSFVALILGFESIQKASASRHMLVNKLTVLELTAQVTGLVAMISFALIQKSVWALVLGTVVQNIVHLVGTYVFLPGSASKLVWNKKEFIGLFDFGKWLLLTVLLGFFVKNSDKLILGALVAPKILGIYSIAIFLVRAIQEVFYKWGSAVTLPVLSRVYRDEREKLQKTYYKFGMLLDAVTLFLAGLLFNASYILIEVLYDSRYDAAGHMMQILSIALLGSKTIMADQLYVAVGKPKLSVPMNILQLLVLFVGIVPAYKTYGLDGALFVIGFSIILALPITWFYLNRLGVLNWKKELVTLPALFLGYGFSQLVVIGYDSIRTLFI